MKLNKKLLRLVSVVLVIIMTLSLAACGDKPSSEPSGSIVENSSALPPDSSVSDSSEPETSSDSSSGSSSSSSGGLVKDTRTPAQIQADMLAKTVAHHQKNPETIGWLYIPDTTINEAVVQHPKDIKSSAADHYYLRKNSLGANDYYGCYYADARGIVFNRDTLPTNTVIYGHSIADDPLSDKGKHKFGQLNRYLDKKFAEEHQFIYMSTPESEMVWQVFAVFDTTTAFNYNEPNPDPAAFLNQISGARSRSKFNFAAKVGSTDNILTLSTCTYRYDVNYPNKYRYVVMAKLLEKGAALTPGKVEVNPTIAQP